MSGQIMVQRAADRPRTRLPWLDSSHSFSFGSHYDPANMGHGLLIVNNDDRVQAGTGFSTHPHEDMEIVTWVLSGELEHVVNGKSEVLKPGMSGFVKPPDSVRHKTGPAGAKVVVVWVPGDEGKKIASRWKLEP